jgi:hypothetical protein
VVSELIEDGKEHGREFEPCRLDPQLACQREQLLQPSARSQVGEGVGLAVTVAHLVEAAVRLNHPQEDLVQELGLVGARAIVINDFP